MISLEGRIAQVVWLPNKETSALECDATMLNRNSKATYKKNSC